MSGTKLICITLSWINLELLKDIVLILLLTEFRDLLDGRAHV